MSGKGFWDVVDENMVIVGTLAMVGMWAIRGMWQDWCVASATERIALAKLKSQQSTATAATPPKKEQLSVEGDDGSSDSETF
jgi:hypothetical protein